MQFFISGDVGADSYTSGVIFEPAMSPFAAQAGVFEIIFTFEIVAQRKPAQHPQTNYSEYFWPDSH